MHGMERFKPVAKNEGPTNAEAYAARERERENYFRTLVRKHLLETLEDELYEAGLSDEDIDSLDKSLQDLTDEQADRVLSIPAELRPTLFARIKQRMDSNESAESIIRDLDEKFGKHGFTAGYHLSPRQIPKVRKSDGSIDWTIRGSEFDDRDEMKMTYYSLDYMHRYKKKPARYLYIVRAEMGPTSSHKKDTSNNWGRAPLLPVVDEMDMAAIEERIDALVKEKEKRRPS